ncbi:MAG: septal ring lytic transglycosylase RlpA family protein [Verrucomicrobiota bacterium]
MILTPSRVLRAAAILACSMPVASCAQSGKTKSPAKIKTSASAGGNSSNSLGAKIQRGIASIYRDHRTASGERFLASALCAAHPSLPMGTRVKVTCMGTGRSTVVRINDRGPFKKGRIIDLTPAAAAQIGLTQSKGLTSVELSPMVE